MKPLRGLTQHQRTQLAKLRLMDLAAGGGEGVRAFPVHDAALTSSCVLAFLPRQLVVRFVTNPDASVRLHGILWAMTDVGRDMADSLMGRREVLPALPAAA